MSSRWSELEAALEDANRQLLERDKEFLRLAAARDEELRRTREWATNAIARLELEIAGRERQIDELTRGVQTAQALIEPSQALIAEMRATPFWKPGRAYVRAKKALWPNR